MTMRTITLPLAALLATGVIAGCGDDETTSQTSDAGDTTTEMGSFALVTGAPDGFDDVSGTATLVRNDAGTDVAIELSGLKPDMKYASHVHADFCDQADPGGPHFKFAADGADTPPNEIHLPFQSDADGNGSATAHNDQTVPVGEGKSIVVHTAPAAETSDAGSDDHASTPSRAAKIACASLDTGDASDGASAATTKPTPSTPASEDSESLAIDVKGGTPVGGVKSLTVKKGDRVRFTVSSDTTSEIHVHAYDIMKDAGPGKPATFDFKAAIEGIFEVEVEDTGEQIVKLTVNP